MPQIPTYDQWMKDTHSLTSPRSEYLKKVDEALKAFHRSPAPATKSALKYALGQWCFEQGRQGADWKRSVRNSKGAVTSLHRALNDLDKRKLAPEELEALKYIAQSQRIALQKQFFCAKLQFKASTLLGMANSASTKLQRFKTGASAAVKGGLKARSAATKVNKVADLGALARRGVNLGRAAPDVTVGPTAAAVDPSGSLGPIRTAIMDFLRELCPGVDVSHVFRALNLGPVETFAADIAPFVGVISSGGKAVYGWIGVARTAWAEMKVLNARDAIAPGDPDAAFEALVVMLDRDIASKTARATTKTAGFTGKTLAAFADLGAATGPAIGLLELLADIFQTIVEYVADYLEGRAGNEALQAGALDLGLFKVCPILGCYFLVVQDHSTIINFAVGDYGTENWVFDVERLVKKIEPVLSRAQHYIGVSRLEMPGMSQAKGVVKKDYSHTSGFGKVTGAPGALKDKIADQIESWLQKPEKPVVDKSRIVGIGSS